MKSVPISLSEFTAHLLGRVRQVQRTLGRVVAETDEANVRFADLLDSMGMVEFLALLADDCGMTPEAIEACVEHRFGTVAELACALHTAGHGPVAARREQAAPHPAEALARGSCATVWLAGTAMELPRTVQSAAALDAALGRPAGWLESHAGIRQRHIWAGDDPLTAAVDAARECLDRAGVHVEEVGALLLTAEAPPLLAGLAAAVHHRLDLRPAAVALEIGGACTGFLAAMWMARMLMARTGVVLIVAVEAPSQYLQVQPGPAGEAAALLGDAAAACLLRGHSRGDHDLPLIAVELVVDGSAGSLLRVEQANPGGIELHFDGGALASRAVRVMAQAVRDLAQQQGVRVSDLQAVVAHGGNGRLPALLARRLGLPPERVWSETGRTANLGAASLPVAWAAHQPRPSGIVAWTAVGAGLTWGAALTG